MLSFTPSQVWTFVIAVIGLTLTVINIIDKVSTMKKNAQAPMKDLEKRIATLELEMAQTQAKLLRGNDQFRKQKRINTMFERIQLAFVDFEVAYCNENGYKNVENLIKAKDLLEELLTDGQHKEDMD